MSGIATAIVGSTIISGAMQSDAASDAASAQTRSNAASIAEQRRQFDEIQKLLAPYISAGTTAIGGLQPYAQAGAPALQQQQALLGLAGPQAQQAAISALEKSPAFTSMVKQGENALLQSASATGGLRGGNVQGALAEFRPQVLAQLIDQQYSRLGGLTALGQTTQQNIAQLGQSSAAGVGSAGLSTASNIANLMQASGAAQAGAELAQAQAMGGIVNSIPSALGTYYGMTGRTPFGSTFGGSTAPSIASTYGTIPGSQQTAMLNAQMAGF